MNVSQQIESRLQAEFRPEYLEVVNESHMHNVPPGSETHFKVVIVAQAFVHLRKVARHQAVYRALAEQLAGPVHALALHAWSPEEWAQRAGVVAASPQCMGGSGA